MSTAEIPGTKSETIRIDENGSGIDLLFTSKPKIVRYWRWFAVEGDASQKIAIRDQGAKIAQDNGWKPRAAQSDDKFKLLEKPGRDGRLMTLYIYLYNDDNDDDTRTDIASSNTLRVDLEGHEQILYAEE